MSVCVFPNETGHRYGQRCDRFWESVSQKINTNIDSFSTWLDTLVQRLSCSCCTCPSPNINMSCSCNISCECFTPCCQCIAGLVRRSRQKRLRVVVPFTPTIELSEESPQPSDNNCPICMCELSSFPYVGTCGKRGKTYVHNFHITCLNEWRKIHDNCPICKRDYDSDEIARLDEMGMDIV